MSITLNNADLLSTVVVILLVAGTVGRFLVWFAGRSKAERRDLIEMIRALWRK